ncbi:TetR family transcriptional regulator [Propioniciclava tarda]|uniref:TetR family transcriptional regulator n=2 Tax=Propioniciclava tarda TaxID=433330 RepID=A0A4Q9KKV1_PROTD|nr:TetR family transcriptional regulator [Propioniciclava tarda]
MLIAHGGIEGVTFRRVAKQAGVSVGRVQHHFGTRDSLVRAACIAMIDGAQAAYVELPSDPIARLRHILLHAVPDNPHTRFGTSVWYAYLAKSVSDPKIGRLLAVTKRGTEDECVRLLGSRPEATPIARRLLALADGLAVRVLVGDLSGIEARETLETELAHVLSGDVAESRTGR